MRVDFYIPKNGAKDFAKTCEAVIFNVGTAAKWITEIACEEIYDESQRQVPKDTGTLASTGFWEVRRNMATKGYTYFGIVGYAGMTGQGASHDKPNPESGIPASVYAAVVHEDLEASHEGFGEKAKFLEDPINEYAEEFARVARKHFAYAIEHSNEGISYVTTRI